MNGVTVSTQYARGWKRAMFTKSVEVVLAEAVCVTGDTHAFVL